MTDAGLQRVVFLAACVVILLTLAPRAWVLRALFLDPVARAQVRAAMERAADAEGWLLSDLSLQSVDPTNARVLRRPPRRAPAPVTGYDLPLAGGRPSPCPAS